MKTTHTPGPWELQEITHASEGLVYFVKGANATVQHKSKDTAGEANARLIAAAPELLAALQRAEALLSIAYNPGIEDSVTLAATSCQWATNAARAAIAKATGQANP